MNNKLPIFPKWRILIGGLLALLLVGCQSNDIGALEPMSFNLFFDDSISVDYTNVDIVEYANGSKANGKHYVKSITYLFSKDAIAQGAFYIMLTSNNDIESNVEDAIVKAVYSFDYDVYENGVIINEFFLAFEEVNGTLNDLKLVQDYQIELELSISEDGNVEISLEKVVKTKTPNCFQSGLRIKGILTYEEQDYEFYVDI